VMAQALLASNFFFWKQTGYFAPGSEMKPLLHTWSLAVEEQFYLLFPLLLIFLVHRKKFSLVKTIVWLAIVSFTLSVAGSYSSNNWSATFYLLPTRAWELLIGASLAATRGRFSVSGPAREAAGWLGIALVCWAVFFYDGGTPFPGLAALPPCLGAALIIFSSGSKLSLVGRILAFKPVVFIGLISYSLYLWHWPLLVFPGYLSRDALSAGFRIALLAISVVLAILSWKYVEKPFRKRQIFQRRPQIFSFAGASMAALLGLGLFVSQRDGLPSRFPAKVLAYADARHHGTFLNDLSLKQAKAGQFVELGSKDTNQPVSVLIWGDSHAMALTPVFDDLCRHFSRRGIEATRSVTPPILGSAKLKRGKGSRLKETPPDFAQDVLSFIAQRHVKNVVMTACWSKYDTTDSFKSNLLSTVRAVIKLGTKVYVIKDIPDQVFDVPRFAALAALQNGDFNQLGVTREEHEMANRELQPTFDEISKTGATVLDPAEYFLNRNGLYGAVKNDQALYRDSGLLRVEGSRFLSPLFEPMFHVE